MGKIRLYFQLPSQIQNGEELALDARGYQYLIKARRLKRFDHFIVFNGNGWDYPAQIVRIEKRNAWFRLDSPTLNSNESSLDTTLALAIGAHDKTDLSLQKAVELGVTRIQMLISDRSPPLEQTRLKKRLEHWQGVIISACEQCQRSKIPSLTPPYPIGSWIQQMSPCPLLFFDPTAMLSAHDLELTNQAVTLVIGPEGGFSKSEEECLRQAGGMGIQLGPRILRMETAVTASLSLLQFLYGDWRMPTT